MAMAMAEAGSNRRSSAAPSTSLGSRTRTRRSRTACTSPPVGASPWSQLAWRRAALRPAVAVAAAVASKWHPARKRRVSAIYGSRTHILEIGITIVQLPASRVESTRRAMKTKEGGRVVSRLTRVCVPAVTPRVSAKRFFAFFASFSKYERRIDDDYLLRTWKVPVLHVRFGTYV